MICFEWRVAVVIVTLIVVIVIVAVARAVSYGGTRVAGADGWLVDAGGGGARPAPPRSPPPAPSCSPLLPREDP